MKKVKFMLAAISILAAIAGALAFKSKTFNIYCLYRTTVVWDDQEELSVNVCKTLGQVDFTPFPNGIVFHAAYTIPDLCWNLPSLTPMQYCNNIYTITILP